MSEKEYEEVRFKIPPKVHKLLCEQIKFEVGDYVVQAGKVNTFAKMCFYRGLGAILKEKKLLHEPAEEDGSAKSGALAESEPKKRKEE